MKRSILNLWIALATAQGMGLGQTIFTKITAGDIVNELGRFNRGAWGDFNNDGFLDVYVTNYGGTNVFYRNNGNGTFTRIGQGYPLIQRADNYDNASWADYDNDGNLDLLVPVYFPASPNSGQVLLFHNDGESTFSRVSGQPLTDQLGSFNGCWVDYDNDGFVDLLIYNVPDQIVGGRGQLYHNNGDGTFTARSLASDLVVPWALLWADYDNDGFMDLLVVSNNPNTVNALYHNNRNGTFTRVLTNAIATDRWPGGDNSGGNGGAWGDYDNDGFPDLFVAANPGIPNRLYHNNGDGTFTKINSGPTLAHAAGVSSTGSAWADYDNDGFLDLFVSNVHGRNQLFHNNGDGTFTEILTGDPVEDGGTNTWYFGVSWVDYDNDGFLDLFVAGSGTDQWPGKNLLYHNNGNTNTWIEVKCVGTLSNRSAIGAKVRVHATIAGRTFWQLREITEGSGFNSPPLIAHFGLGDATNADALRIEWPSGAVQEFRNVAARQILTITEPPRLLASATNGAPQIFLKAWPGMKFAIQSSADLASWAPVATITITNRNGTAPIIDTNPPALDYRFYRAVSP